MKKLDDRILKESELRDKKDNILDDRKSQKSAGGAPRASSQRPGAHGDLDTKSVASSHISGASRLSRAGRKEATVGNKDKPFDT